MTFPPWVYRQATSLLPLSTVVPTYQQVPPATWKSLQMVSLPTQWQLLLLRAVPIPITVLRTPSSDFRRWENSVGCPVQASFAWAGIFVAETRTQSHADEHQTR